MLNMWNDTDIPLGNERSIERAIDYVTNGQGDDLPEFDLREEGPVATAWVLT